MLTKDKTQHKQQEILKILQQQRPHLRQLKSDYKKHKKDIAFSPLVLKNYYSEIPYIVAPQPSFKDPSLKEMQSKSVLKSRQLEYLQGVCRKQYFPKELLEQLLAQNVNQFVKKRRTTSIFTEDNTKLVYSAKDQIKALKITYEEGEDNQIHIRSTPCKTIEVDSGEIYELFPIDDKTVIRTLYQIKLFHKENIILKKRFPHEIVNSFVNPFNHNQVLLSIYDDNHSIIKKLFLDRNEEVDLHQSTFLVNCIQNYDINTSIISNSAGIELCDSRYKKATPFYNVKNIINQRIYEMVWLRTQMQNTPYFMVSNNQHFQTFDIRNPYGSVYVKRHMCEEAPPTILQYFEANYRNTTDIRSLLKSQKYVLPRPILIATSPRSAGYSMFMEVDVSQDPTQISKEQYHGGLINQKRSLHNNEALTMLFDSGKIYEQIRPRSIAPLMYKNKLLQFFHIDSSGGVAYESFKIKPKSTLGYQPNVYINSEKTLKAKQIPQPNISYIKELQRNKYLEKQTAKRQQDTNIQEQQNEIKKDFVESRHVVVADMRRFLDRICELSLSTTKNQYYSIQEQQPFYGEMYYQNMEASQEHSDYKISRELVQQLQQKW